MNLYKLFNPKSVAVIGASQNFNSISGQPIVHLKDHGYKGEIYPINPKYEEVYGYKCYRNVDELPVVPDLALILVNAARVPKILLQCGKKGIPFSMIFSAGFSEIGKEGTKLQEVIIDIAKEFNMGVIGPNCQGMMNISENIFAGFGSTFYIDSYQSGNLSLVTQSGGFGYAVVSLVDQAGLGFRQVISTGNEVGVSTLDFIDYFLEDPETEIIAGYVESLKDGYRLIEIGEKALRKKKPILIWKVGNSEVGKKAAASHTGNLGGETALYKAAFKQKGIIQVNDIYDLVDYGKAFKHGKLPKGNRVAIVTISGGAGIVLADQCVERGLEIPKLSEETLERLKKIIPSFGSLVNPIDVTAHIFNETDLLREALQVIVEDPQIDSVVVINASVPGTLALKIANEIVEVNKRTDKPIFISWSTRDELAKEAYELLELHCIPRYTTPVRCGNSLGVITEYQEAYSQFEKQNNESVLVIKKPEINDLIIKENSDITEYNAKKVLKEYGINITQEEIATNKEEAVRIAERIGYPVVMKIQSPDISHKTEAKAVRLGIYTKEEVLYTFDEILQNAISYNPNAQIEGVLIQEMVRDGVEVILGITNDKLFGPAVMFGLGGIFAEVMKDVTFRLAPLTKSMAIEMIQEIKGYPILTGIRGKPPADLEALTDALLNLSAMAVDLKESVAELDINPLFVFEKGKGVKAGDALIKPLKNSHKEFVIKTMEG